MNVVAAERPALEKSAIRKIKRRLISFLALLALLRELEQSIRLATSVDSPDHISSVRSISRPAPTNRRFWSLRLSFFRLVQHS
jgi:hypothetical protein